MSSRVVSERLAVSFGVWNMLAAIMAQDEFLKLQALNHFSYAVNISRCQPSWAVDYHIPAFKESILTEPEHYFTSPELLRFEKLIIKISKRKKNFAQVKSNDINVYKSKTF